MSFNLGLLLTTQLHLWVAGSQQCTLLRLDDAAPAEQMTGWRWKEQGRLALRRVATLRDRMRLERWRWARDRTRKLTMYSGECGRQSRLLLGVCAWEQETDFYKEV